MLFTFALCIDINTAYCNETAMDHVKARRRNLTYVELVDRYTASNITITQATNQQNNQHRMLVVSGSLPCQPFPQGLYQIKTCIKWPNRYLSAHAEGNVVDVYSKQPESIRQNWYLQPIPNSCDYNIVVSGGVNCHLLGRTRKTLSTTRSGRRIDLWYNDDKSGRQRWKFVPILNSDFLYHIEVVGGVKRRRTILGVRRTLFRRPTRDLMLFHRNFVNRNAMAFCWHIARVDKQPP